MKKTLITGTGSDPCEAPGRLYAPLALILLGGYSETKRRKQKENPRSAVEVVKSLCVFQVVLFVGPGHTMQTRLHGIYCLYSPQTSASPRKAPSLISWYYILNLHT